MIRTVRCRWGSFQIQIVNYDPSYQTQKTYDANWFCLGVIVQANGNTAFLSGDMGDDDGDLTRIMENYSAVWDLEVLEVNHHGLFDSMTDAFVQATHPDIMILPGRFSNVKTFRLNLNWRAGNKIFCHSGLYRSEVSCCGFSVGSGYNDGGWQFPDL